MLNFRTFATAFVVLIAVILLLSSSTEARPQLPSMLQTLYMPGFNPYGGNAQYAFFGRR
ncbi:hypothetical protein AAVH_26535 [Aphelenchoides avenae]|nr:hypothetical protein AAVH_26535 [Aphelenchus avenae]